MDSFGFYYNKDLLQKKSSYLKYFGFNPENKENIAVENIFDRIRSSIKRIFDDKVICDNFLPLIHHARIVELIKQEKYSAPFEKFLENCPDKTQYGYHFPFPKSTKLSGKDFVSRFHAEVPYLDRYGVKSIVIHPPSKIRSKWRKIRKHITDPVFLKDLREHDVCIALENMTSGYYSDIANLTDLRKKIELEYDRLGYAYLMDKIQFCFDTGHYLRILLNKNIDVYSKFGDMKDFARNIKVFHIHTISGYRDDHLVIRKKLYPIPKNKKSPFKKNQSNLIENSIITMKWVEFCIKNRNSDYDLEFLQEVDDYVNVEALIEAGQWLTEIISNIESHKSD